MGLTLVAFCSIIYWQCVWIMAFWSWTTSW